MIIINLCLYKLGEGNAVNYVARPLTWCLGVHADGLNFKFHNMNDAVNHWQNYDVVADFTENIEQEGVALRFLRVLDTLVSHAFACIIVCVEKVLTINQCHFRAVFLYHRSN